MYNCNFELDGSNVCTKVESIPRAFGEELATERKAKNKGLKGEGAVLYMLMYP